MSTVKFIIKEKDNYSKSIVRMLREIAEKNEFIQEEKSDKKEIVNDIKIALKEVEEIKAGKKEAKTLKVVKHL